MKSARHIFRSRFLLLLLGVLFVTGTRAGAEPLTLKRAVQLALTHSTAMAQASADEQRAFASYAEARNQYVPQVVAGSGLGASWGFPLSLEGAAPSIFNVNAQSALINPALRDFVRAAKTEWKASGMQTKDQRNQVIQDAVLSYAELSKWEALQNHLREEQADAIKTEQVVNERIQEGIDNSLARNKARLNTARVRMRMAEAQGAVDVLRNRLSQMTGISATLIETVPDSIPPLPEVKRRTTLSARQWRSVHLCRLRNITPPLKVFGREANIGQCGRRWISRRNMPCSQSTTITSIFIKRLNVIMRPWG